MTCIVPTLCLRILNTNIDSFSCSANSRISCNSTPTRDHHYLYTIHAFTLDGCTQIARLILATHIYQFYYTRQAVVNYWPILIARAFAQYSDYIFARRKRKTIGKKVASLLDFCAMWTFLSIWLSFFFGSPVCERERRKKKNVTKSP